MEVNIKSPAVVLYTNWKGKTEQRTISPLEIYWGHTEFHPEDQFLLKCIDLDKDAERTYAMKDISKIISGAELFSNIKIG